MGELTLVFPNQIPPSYNMIGYTGGPNSRWKTTRIVKQWKNDLYMTMAANNMPRKVGRVEATATLRFKTKRVRDEGNYRVVIEKALGDALTDYRAIVNDDHEHYSFGRVFLLHDRTTRSTEVVLRWQDTDAHQPEGEA